MATKIKLSEAVKLSYDVDFLAQVRAGNLTKEGKAVARTIQAAVLKNVKRLEVFEKETGYTSETLRLFRTLGASTSGDKRTLELQLINLRNLYGGAQSNVTKVKDVLKAAGFNPKDFTAATNNKISNAWIYAEFVIGSAIWDAMASDERAEIVSEIEGETDSEEIRQRLEKYRDDYIARGKVVFDDTYEEI